MFVLEVVLLLFWHASGTASEGQLGIRDGWLDDAVWCNFASSVFGVCGLVLSDEGSAEVVQDDEPELVVLARTLPRIILKLQQGSPTHSYSPT